jgi:predicted N-formylglutamate amidohydrolase
LKLILTCEHGGNRIPKQYLEIFEGAEAVLHSHRGFDPGALDLFSALRDRAYFSQYQSVSRLLVEANRSLHHPQLFSEFSQQLSKKNKREVLEKYYFPYRNSVEAVIAHLIKEGKEVLHLSIHTFTPKLHEQVRKADIGLLYDPKRTLEKNISIKLKKELYRHDSTHRLRFNYPYQGTADGFTTYLRKKFTHHYAGIEIEVNQKHVLGGTFPSILKENIYKAVSAILDRRI